MSNQRPGNGSLQHYEMYPGMQTVTFFKTARKLEEYGHEDADLLF